MSISSLLIAILQKARNYFEAKTAQLNAKTLALSQRMEERLITPEALE